MVTPSRAIRLTSRLNVHREGLALLSRTLRTK